ncbi:MAG: glucose-6-phosphate 1-epimerase [Kiritimatiellia bacterium]
MGFINRDNRLPCSLTLGDSLEINNTMNIASTIQHLYQQYGQISGITIECQNELVAIGIKNKVATAEVFLQGAQLTHYQRITEKPILFLSEDCSYNAGSPLRGGIPICWPWFGDLAKNPHEIQQQLPEAEMTHAPAHGFVRSRQWVVEAISTPSDQLTIIELKYDITVDEALWPFATSLRYRIEIGDTLSASFSVTNTGNQAFVFTSSLHSYFSVSHIDHVSIQGFDKSPYFDALDTDAQGQWLVKQQQGNIHFSEAVDRVYHTTGTPIVLKDKSLNKSDRNISLRSAGSNSTVVWNPWIEKSQQLTQFALDDYQRMVCIETANAVEDKITLAPNASHTLSLLLE